MLPSPHQPLHPCAFMLLPPFPSPAHSPSSLHLPTLASPHCFPVPLMPPTLHRYAVKRRRHGPCSSSSSSSSSSPAALHLPADTSPTPMLPGVPAVVSAISLLVEEELVTPRELTAGFI